jgi:hypothetical protein
MSHAPGPAQPGTTSRPRSYRSGIGALKNGATQLLGVSKVASRLGPKQIKDELQIAKLEMKEKGIKFGVGAAFVVAGLAFLLLAVIALVVAAVAGLSKVMEAWLAALLIAALFIVILAVLALIGLAKIKAQLPLKPESAIFGLLYDIGVAKEGSEYTATRVRREMREKQEAKQQAKDEESRRRRAGEAPEVPQPSRDQLEQRTKARRDHLKSLRDDLGQQAQGIRSTASGLVGKTKHDARTAPDRARSAASGFAANAQDPEALRLRWKPLTVLAVSLGTAAIFLARLLKRR